MTPTPATPLPDADGLRTPLAPTLILSAAWALGIGGTTMMPLLVTNTMARLHLDEGQATLMTGIEMIGMLAGCVLLPRLARRVPAFYKPAATTAALVLLALSQMLTALTLSAPLFGALRLVAGVCESQMIVLVGMCLARHRDAERLWGVVLLLSGLAVAGVFTLVSLLPGVAAGAGIWVALALLAAVLGVAAARAPALVPARPSTPTPTPMPGGAHRRAGVWLAWGVFVGVYSVQAGVWAVSALQGERIGLSLPAIGTALALSSLLGFFGAVVPALPALAARRGPTVMGALLVMFASVACFFTADGMALFFIGQLTLNMGFYAIMAVLNSFISARDHDGTLLSQSVVVTFAAVAVGTVGAGELFQDAGALGVIGFSLLALAASVPLGLKALRGQISASPAL